MFGSMPYAAGEARELTLEWISTLAEIIAALGVIVSILYLAKQIRAGSNIEDARAVESAINSWHAATGNLLDEANRNVFLKGLSNYEALTESERFHFHALSAHLIDRFEIILHIHKRSPQLPRLQDILGIRITIFQSIPYRMASRRCRWPREVNNWIC
jgi:hypothetical protein